MWLLKGIYLLNKSIELKQNKEESIKRERVQVLLQSRQGVTLSISQDEGIDLEYNIS